MVLGLVLRVGDFGRVSTLFLKRGFRGKSPPLFISKVSIQHIKSSQVCWRRGFGIVVGVPQICIAVCGSLSANTGFSRNYASL